ncbi:MAG TPA: hypothetical protein VLH13_00685 [Methanomassiliicoccales archaeon]|nr:hypothetical protein [Methanomassiliicoccales archaeon]
MAETAAELQAEIDKAEAEYMAKYDSLVALEDEIEEKFGIKVYGKKFYRSKTFWVNLAAAGLAAYQIWTGHALDEETMALVVVPAMNLLLRALNKEEPLKL